MNKKIVSLVVAAMMLAQSSVLAESLHDYVNTFHASYLDNVSGSNLFSYTKFNQSINKVPSEITPAVIATVGASGQTPTEHPISAPLYGTTSANTFDFKVELDMDNVKNAFNNLYQVTTTSIDLNSARTDAQKTALKTQFDNSTVSGSFTVTVTYDADFTFTAPTTAAEFDFTQDGADPQIFAIDMAGTDVTSNPAVVKFDVTGNPTIADLKASSNQLLDNIVLKLDNVVANANNKIMPVSATLVGQTTIFDGADAYAIMDYKSIDDKNTAAVYIPVSGGGHGGSPITSTTIHAYIVVDGKQTPITVTSENKTYSIDIDSIEKPVKDGFIFEGWYLDPEYTIPASGTMNITHDTYLYAKFTPISLPGKPSVSTVIGSVITPQEMTEEEGKYTFDVDSLEAPEKEGFVFDGWYLTPYLTDKASGVIDITAPTYLYPKYINISAPEELISDEHILYIVGYPDGEVKPNGNITREEVVAAFYRLLKPEYRATIETTDNNFPDMSPDRWSNISVSTMANGGYIVGDENGYFNPSTPITRAEFVTIANKFAPADAVPAVNYFSDIEGHWAENFILTATGQYWIAGYEDGSFRPNKYITRAEAMTIINKMLVRYADKAHVYAKEWPDLAESDWYYDAVIEATTHNYYVRDDNQWEEHWISKDEATKMTDETVHGIMENENPDNA